MTSVFEELFVHPSMITSTFHKCRSLYSTEICGQEPAVVVAVVGLGHMNGIKQYFGTEVDLKELLR